MQGTHSRLTTCSSTVTPWYVKRRILYATLNTVLAQGGCVTLQFACVGNDTYSVKQYLRGVVATSPLILLRHQPPQWQLIAGHWLSKLIPWFTIPAPVNAKVSDYTILSRNILLTCAQDLTHDEAVQLAYIEDPLIKEQGTLRGVDSMLRKVGIFSVLGCHFTKWL